MIRFEIPDNVNQKSISVWFATWFGCGFIKPAPGTWGTLGALPVGLLIFAQWDFAGLYAATILITAIGYWVARSFEKQTGIHDSKMVVIDEVAGMWITLLPVLYYTGIHWVWITLAFLIFRLFDIAKPWPISYCDKHIKGAFGVMLDDILAGFVAAFVIVGFYYAGLG